MKTAPIKNLNNKEEKTSSKTKILDKTENNMTSNVKKLLNYLI